MDHSRLELQAMFPEAFPKVARVMQEGLSSQVAPSMVAGVFSMKKPQDAWVGAWGSDVNVNSVFDFASVSKVFATSALAGVCVEKRWLSFDTGVQSVLADYPDPQATLRHLLSHTAGWVWWKPYWEQVRAEFKGQAIESVPVATRQKRYRELLSKLKPDHRVGENCIYSDISMMWAGFMLEAITSMPLDEAVREYVWKPMRIQGASYRRIDRPGIDDPRVVPTEDCPWRGRRLRGVVHDDNCYVMGGYAGHAGVMGQVTDLLQFGRQILSGFFGGEVNRAFFTKVAAPQGCTRTTGWDTPSGEQPAMGRMFSPHSIGHNGYTGTSLWIDPHAGVAIALLTNRVFYGRGNEKIRPFRSQFHDALALDLKSLGLI